MDDLVIRNIPILLFNNLYAWAQNVFPAFFCCDSWFVCIYIKHSRTETHSQHWYFNFCYNIHCWLTSQINWFQIFNFLNYNDYFRILTFFCQWLSCWLVNHVRHYGILQIMYAACRREIVRTSGSLVGLYYLDNFHKRNSLFIAFWCAWQLFTSVNVYITLTYKHGKVKYFCYY